MNISYQWLKQYLPDLAASPEALEDVLPKLGIEVEAILHQGLQACNKVVVGEILSKEKHPNADRLSLCEVSIDAVKKPLQIVCGAQNHKTGDKVPVALDGAVLAGNFLIKHSKVRGVASEGMLCSAKELGLAEESEGLLILDSSAPLGAPIRSLFPEQDAILDLGITPNRGDAISHLGIARCLSAYYKIPLKEPHIQDLGDEQPASELLKSVHISSADCPYYVALCIEGVHVKDSPQWLKRDLEAVGLKPINNIVDITNWVMLELGQPLHAFDAKNIKSQIEVRAARPGEKLHALNDTVYDLNENILVIADSEQPLALAGVMGGKASAIDDTTQTIILESAYFRPSAIRKTTQRLGLITDSAYRFVRDVDPQGVLRAASRAVELILKEAGGQYRGKVLKVGDINLNNKKISLSYAYILQKCGFSLAKETITQAWESLGCTVKLLDDDTWDVEVPSRLRDIERPIDLLEELIRVYGTHNIPEDRPKLSSLSIDDAPSIEVFKKLESYLFDRGFVEAYNYTTTSQAKLLEWNQQEELLSLGLANPLTHEQTHLRNSLIPGLLKTAQYNLHQKNAQHRFFESGKTFININNRVEERFTLACILLPKPDRSWEKTAKEDFYTAKGLLEGLLSLAQIKGHSYQALTHTAYQEGYAALVSDGGKEAPKMENRGGPKNNESKDLFFATCGTLNLDLTAAYDIPQALAIEISFSETFFKTKGTPPYFKSFSTFPSISKDLALVVDASLCAEEASEDIRKLLKGLCPADFYLKHLHVFDVFQGQGLPEGQKSLGFEIAFVSDSRTLKDAEVNAVFNDLQKELEALKTYRVRRTV